MHLPALQQNEDPDFSLGSFSTDPTGFACRFMSTSP
jgi:hypothetical protein